MSPFNQLTLYKISKIRFLVEFQINILSWEATTILTFHDIQVEERKLMQNWDHEMQLISEVYDQATNQYI